MQGTYADHPALLNSPARGHPLRLVVLGLRHIYAQFSTHGLMLDLHMVDNSQLAERLSVFNSGHEARNVLIEWVCALTADAAFQDDVHEVSVVALAENDLLCIDLDKLRMLVDLLTHVRLVPLDEPQVAHELLEDLVVALTWLLNKLVLDHFDVTLRVPHVLLHIHVSFAFPSDLVSVDEELTTVFQLVIRGSIHILQLELELFLFEVVRSEHVDYLIRCSAIIL